MPVVRDLLLEAGIRLQRYTVGSHKALCPKCSHTRSNKTDPCLSVTIEDSAAVWNCHHCTWTGSVTERPAEQIQYRRREPVKPEHTLPKGVSPKLAAWFGERGISPEIIARHAIGLENDTITFPYTRLGEIVNVKYRTFDKRFRQVKDAEKVYFGLDDIDGAETIIVTEGEIDKLSLEVAGFRNVVSVPDGAPKMAKDDVPDPEDDRKFEYVWNCRKYFEAAKKIILATDGDGPGQALAEELARRYGKHRCWRVTWPDGQDIACKDANDVLVLHGPTTLREVIDRAKPFPIKSLHDAEAFETNALRLFRGEAAKAFSTGWPDVDKHFKVRPGEFSVVTGVPGSGKSQFIDAMTMNLAERSGWKIAVCSFENPPAHHVAKLAELHLDMPFWPGPRARMSENDLRRAIAWLNERYFFIRADDESPTIDWILETARGAVLRYGINGLVIDPYNEIEHKRSSGQTETEYVSELIAKVKRFAQSHGVHVWFVAHPAKPQKLKSGEYADITLYDISGSSHWVNKADIGIVVVRDHESRDVEIQVKKVRFKEIGEPGIATLQFDRATGRYSNARAAG